MGFAPHLAGPHDPVTASPRRQPGSVRRTSSIDTGRSRGVGAQVAEVDARARDLLTASDGDGSVIRETRMRLEIDQPVHHVVSIDDPGLAALVGALVGSGFRGRAAEAMGNRRYTDPLRYMLLDDLPGATLVSGVAVQHAATAAGRAFPSDTGPEMQGYVLAQADICAGWDTEGAMLDAFRADGQLPTPLGPPAPQLDDPRDPNSWHDMAPLTPHATRRCRRLDLGPVDPDGTCTLDAHFRDSHVDAHGLERVVHEYTLRGTIDTAAGTTVEIEPRAQVLPWLECPAALASAHRILGVPLVELREHVRAEFTGLSTCTHLNDMLRSLADVPTMLETPAS